MSFTPEKFCQEAKNWKDVLGKEKTLIIEESIGQWAVSLTNKTKNFHLETKQEEMIGQCPLFLKKICKEAKTLEGCPR